MSDWNNDSSWSGISPPIVFVSLLYYPTVDYANYLSGGGAAAAGSGSWDAGVPLSSDWDAGTKGTNAHDTEIDAFTNGNVETNGDYDKSMDNAGGGGDDRACRM